MSKKRCLLVESPDGWRLLSAAECKTSVLLDDGNSAAPETLAQQVDEWITESGLARDGLFIGVSSTSTLTADFELAPAEQRNRRVLGYELESHLPLAAEEMVADFFSQGPHLLGVCIELDRWLPLVMELEMRGLKVQTIAPVALLALQSLLKHQIPRDADLLVWREGESTELFRLGVRGPLSWVHCNSDGTTLAQQIAVLSLQADQRLDCIIVNGSDELASEVQAVVGETVQFGDFATGTMMEHACAAVSLLSDGRESPWVELRREELAAGDPHRKLRGALRVTAVSAALLLLAVILSTWNWSRQYTAQREELRQQQAAVFQKVFPDSRVPAAIVSRLRSERAKLAGARGDSGDIELPVPALRVLYELLTALPEQQRFRLRELRVENGQVDLDVELRSHGAANSLVEALEQQGFEVAAPSTAQQGDKTVASRLFASLPMNPPEAVVSSSLPESGELTP